MLPQEVTLHVQSGRHAGAVITLDGESATIGRGPGCDLVLSDPSVEQCHCRIEIRPDGVAITALEGAVVVPGQGEVEPGFRTRLSSSAALTIGALALDLRIQAPATRRAPLRMLGGAGVVLVAGIGALALFGATMPAAAPEAAPMQAHAAVAPAPVEAPAPVPARTEPSEVALRTSAELERRHLDAVAIEYQNPVFVLSGEISAAQMDAFHEVEQWFDGSYPELVLQTGGVAIKALPATAAAPPAIQSIWYADEPYIVVDDRRYRVGDALPGGWRLEGVDVSHADFVLGDEPYRVRLGPDEDEDAPRLALR